jgi:hypothetical protein
MLLLLCGVMVALQWCIPDYRCLCCTVSQILENQGELLFHLHQQRLIELIRSGNIEEALAFAAEYLAPAGEEQPRLLEELGGPSLCNEHVTNSLTVVDAPAPPSRTRA